MKKNPEPTIFFDEFAEIAESIQDEEWMYYDFIDDLSDQLAQYMVKRGISKAELARKMNKSRPFVTKVLKGDANITMKTFISLLHHLEAKPMVKIIPKDDNGNWYSVLQKKGKPSQIQRWQGTPTEQVKPTNIACKPALQIVA